MTEEEKKEFEEFLQWKAERAKQRENNPSAPVEGQPADGDAGDGDATDASPMKTTDDGQDMALRVFLILGAIFVVLILFFAVKGCHERSEAGEEEMEAEAVEDDSTAVPLPAAETSLAESLTETATSNERVWDFSTEIDEMTDTKNIWASVTSDNFKNLGSPYGLTYCRLTVRYMKKWGGFDVLVQLTSGQIHGNKYSDENYVMVRFDDAKPIKYWYDESADASSHTVFIRNKSDFIARCKKAKVIKVEVPIFQGGRPVFTFEVDSPLVWKE